MKNKSIQFDPSTGEISLLDTYIDEDIPFVRKVLTHNLNIDQKKMQNVEIEISEKLYKYPQKNLVTIYRIQLPTKDSDGYIDMEFLQLLEDTKEYKLNIENINFFDSLENDVLNGLEQLHNLCIVYIDLHVGNVGWSKIDRCWKIFDFNMSGILNEGGNNNCENTWKIEPAKGIIYNKINKDINKIDYDKKAKIFFDEEKEKLKKKKYIFDDCIKCNRILSRRSEMNDGSYVQLESCRKCSSMKKKLMSAGGDKYIKKTKKNNNYSMSSFSQLKRSNIINDLGNVKINLSGSFKIVFRNQILRTGSILTPFFTKKQPKIYYNIPDKRNYTLLMIDLDAPDRKEHKFRSFIHWAISNINIKSGFKKSNVVLEYIGPGPPYHSGYHRYIILLLEQNKKFSLNKLKKYIQSRGGKNIENIMQKGFDCIVAISYFKSKWDKSVDELHKKANFIPPKQYMSPEQKKIFL